MKVIRVSADQADQLVPLLRQVHDLHVLHQPDRYPPTPDDPALVSFL